MRIEKYHPNPSNCSCNVDFCQARTRLAELTGIVGINNPWFLVQGKHESLVSGSLVSGRSYQCIKCKIKYTNNLSRSSKNHVSTISPTISDPKVSFLLNSSTKNLNRKTRLPEDSLIPLSPHIPQHAKELCRPFFFLIHSPSKHFLLTCPMFVTSNLPYSLTGILEGQSFNYSAENLFY